MSNEVELKPCPHCGNSDLITDTELIPLADNKFMHMGFVECITENCPAILRASTEAKAIEKWNARPIEDDLQAKLEVAKDAIKKLLSNLPDSIHEDDDSWNWGWEELFEEAQEAVKDARNEANKALAKIERIGKIK